MPSSFSPPRPSGSSGFPGWRMLWRIPGWLWLAAGELAESLMLRRKQPTGRAGAFALRVASAFLLALLAPLVFMANVIRPQRRPAAVALHKKVVELWQSSPDEAVALLHATLDALIAGGQPSAVVVTDVPPFGRFDITDVSYVFRSLFECEFALGHYEEALQVSRRLSVRSPDAILEQVKCLTAMGRHAEAISLLEKNLDVDNWRQPLHRRLEELSGNAPH